MLLLLLLCNLFINFHSSLGNFLSNLIDGLNEQLRSLVNFFLDDLLAYIFEFFDILGDFINSGL